MRFLAKYHSGIVKEYLPRRRDLGSSTDEEWLLSDES
jgi:hypothetical protein